MAGEIAEKVRYAGNGKHKTYPAPNHEWIPVHRPGISSCDKYEGAAWRQIEDTLKEAIRRSCVQLEAGLAYPVRVWAYVNDTLHEARLSNRANGEYHAFPLKYRSQFPLDPTGLLENAPNVKIPSH